jgi:oxygen-independent coproporphyrinogen-3 oxidase
MTNRPVFISQLDQAIDRHRSGAPPWALFTQRVRTPRAARGALPLAPVADAHHEITVSLDRSSQGSERVVYVHLPFCRSLCSFCGYCRQIPAAQSAIHEYVAAVRRQLEVFAVRPWTRSKAFSAVHFGGGTPTLLPRGVLAAPIQDVTGALPLVPKAEITVESTIAGLEAADLPILVAAGVNRVALGVQTFNSDRRRALGRNSSGVDILTCIADARASGITNLCVDLLYGLPGQKLAMWKADLDTASTCGATGVSAYPLVPFPSSELGRKLATERRDSFVDLATEFSLFVAADSALVKWQGWTRFSPVQYGDAKVGTAAYVTACGRGAEILALGAGAAGNVNGLTYMNTPDIEEFTNSWREGNRWPVTAAKSTAAHHEARRLYALGEATRLVRSPTAGEPAYIAEILGKLVEVGLATTDEEFVSLTPAGCFWAGNICEIFSVAVRDGSGRS